MNHRDPIDCILWRPASELRANDWNPNWVFTPELKLLEFSILTQGWIQPVLINPHDLIIDGFHRHRLSTESPHLQKKYGGLVPTATINVDDAHAMMLTVRINRARGSHTAIKMHSLVASLIDDYGLSPEEVAKEMGMTKDEVELLRQDGVFAAKKIKDWQYSKAWYPAEVARN